IARTALSRRPMDGPCAIMYRPGGRPPIRRLSRPPAAIYAKPASRPRKMRLSREPAEKNNRLRRREKCGLITEKSIIRFQHLQAIRYGHIRRPLSAHLFSLSLCIKRTYFHCAAMIKIAPTTLHSINAFLFRGLGGVLGWKPLI